MIRLNLLKSTQPRTQEFRPLQEPRETEDVEEMSDDQPKSKRLWLLIPVVLVAAGAAAFLSIRISHKKSAAQNDFPVAAVSAPTVDTTEHAVTQTVPDTAIPVPSQTSADSVPTPILVDPSRQLALQAFTAGKWLRDLQSATPVGVGFTRVEFHPPAEFFVHGVASTEQDMQRFQDAFSSLPLQLGQNEIRPVGRDRIAREFTFSGTVRYDTTGLNTAYIRIPPKAELDRTIKMFMENSRALDMAWEVQLRDSMDAGDARLFHYHAEAAGDYSRMLSLLEKLKKTASNIGFERMGLEARGSESMTASLDLAVYAK